MNSCELTSTDWSLIHHLSEIYDKRLFELKRTSLEKYSSETSTIIDFLNDEESVYRNLIEFYKQIPLFQNLHLDDQILLIKSNLTHLVHLHHILKDHFQENAQMGHLMSEWINLDFHKQMSKNRRSLDYFIEHPLVLKISLVMLIFIINLSQSPSKELSIDFLDRRSIIKNQNLLITLLWKYLHRIYDEKHAIKGIQLIVFQYLRYQSLIEDMEMIVSNKFHSNQFHPLTKSVLHLS